ncbi:2-oxo-4-hydroxy-4-carboxy-5-ureidoimidazoline decarboxylase [Streptomyces sp. LE64]|uniref:2-oxo-4-hydroxy-4-carboxy-5-ureidoimidazoline decarboxylase n=1 Tax=Streptomyces sp. LE64 TaxID=3448653 RepID=UPI004041DAC5
MPSHGFLRPTAAAGPPRQRTPVPAGLDRLNSAAPETALGAFLGCCASHRWAARLAAHRPYPTLEALLAAADEAAYDLTAPDLAEALAREAPTRPPSATGPGHSAARTALSAAHAAYESRFGHAFLHCLDDCPPEESLDRVLSALRTRLGHDPEEERTLVADELRRIARGRLTRLAQDRTTTATAPEPTVGPPGTRARGEQPEGHSSMNDRKEPF